MPSTPPSDDPRARRRFYAVMGVVLAATVIAAVVLAVAGFRADGGTRVVELVAAVVLLGLAYVALAVIKISRAGDPSDRG